MRVFLVLALSGLSAFGQAEKFNHVQWSMTFDQPSGAAGQTVLARLRAVIDPSWHMYSLSTPPGPIPTTIKVLNSPAVASFRIFQPAPVRKYDPSFKTDTETYEGTQDFLAEIHLNQKLPEGPVTITFEPRYQTCSGSSCIPPRTRQISATLNITESVANGAIAIPAGYVEAKPDTRAPPKTAPPP